MITILALCIVTQLIPNPDSVDMIFFNPIMELDTAEWEEGSFKEEDYLDYPLEYKPANTIVFDVDTIFFGDYAIIPEGKMNICDTLRICVPEKYSFNVYEYIEDVSNVFSGRYTVIDNDSIPIMNVRFPNIPEGIYYTETKEMKDEQHLNDFIFTLTNNKPFEDLDGAIHMKMKWECIYSEEEAK